MSDGSTEEEEVGKLIIGAEEVDSIVVELSSDVIGIGTMMFVSDVADVAELLSPVEELDCSSERTLDKDDEMELELELAAAAVDEAPRVIVSRLAPTGGACCGNPHPPDLGIELSGKMPGTNGGLTIALVL